MPLAVAQIAAVPAAPLQVAAAAPILARPTVRALRIRAQVIVTIFAQKKAAGVHTPFLDPVLFRKHPIWN